MNKIDLGPGSQIRFLAPYFAQNGEVINSLGPGGEIAKHEIQMQRMDQKSRLWIATDRVFVGERFRLSYVDQLLNEPAESIRASMEKDKAEIERFVRIPAASERLYALSVVLILFSGVILGLSVYAWIGVLK